jgi:NAD(P)H-dependent nitrite reductase small subunit
MTKTTVCRFDELADGTARRVMVGQRPIAVVRCGDQVYACLDSCPHKGGYLSEGVVSTARKEIICPWHRFRFHLENGASVTNPELVVPTFSVRVEDGQIVVESP